MNVNLVAALAAIDHINVLNRQCCDLIDEKRELVRQVAEAREHMRDIVYACENHSAITRPFDQIKCRAQSFLGLPFVGDSNV